MITKGNMARRVRWLLVVLALGGVAPATARAQYAEVSAAPAAAAATPRAGQARFAVVVRAAAAAPTRCAGVATVARPAPRHEVVLRRWLVHSALLI